jgi:A118 family predicted phage portal protein
VPIDYGPDQAWPPPAAAAAIPFYEEWLAWYAGDGDRLHKVYSSHSRSMAPHVRPSQLNGGVSGWLSRKWWGNPVAGQQARRLHVPAASDISTISSDMLFSEPPKLELEQTAGQAQFDDLVETSQFLSTLAEAAEKVSAAGGGYLRQSINVDVSPVPVSEALLPDNADPVFYGPHLVRVTFWRVVSGDNGPTLRHLELHEMVKGVCVVEHALFEGAPDRLGRRVDLTRGDEECRRLATLVDQAGRIDVGTSQLDVVYIPNVRPHRLLRHTMLGRSDYAGAEGAMDGLDETMSSWMRDIRLGKGRVIVPREYLRRGAPGEGTAFDPEQEIFQAVTADVPGDGTLSMTIVQFQIRVQEHRDTVAAHWRTITSCAGLDTSDHDTDNGPMMTATQVNDKGSRKRATRGKKIQYMIPAIQQAAMVLQELAGMTASRVKVEFPDSSAPDIQTLAQTLQLISAAQAASTRTLVQMLHPDWEETDVDVEVERISAATAAPEDPGSFSSGAPDPQPVDNPVDDAAAVTE